MRWLRSVGGAGLKLENRIILLSLCFRPGAELNITVALSRLGADVQSFELKRSSKVLRP